MKKKEANKFVPTQQANQWNKIFSYDIGGRNLYLKHWLSHGWVPYPVFQGTVGEAKDIKAHGYKKYIGFGGGHLFFHTPKDQLDSVTPVILEDIGQEMVDMFWQIIGISYYSSNGMS